MSLAFYTHPQSRGRIVRWMLEEVGAAYDTVVVEYGPAMQAAEFAAINPMRKVPAIVHDGRVVTESPAILAYLADAFPDAGLAPPLAERHAYYRWLFFAAGPIESAVTHRALGFEVPDDPHKRGMLGYGDFERIVDVLSGLLTGATWVAADRFTAADLYLGAHLAWGMRFGTLPDRPEFRAYAERATDRDAYRRAASLDDALAGPGAAAS